MGDIHNNPDAFCDFTVKKREDGGRDYRVPVGIDTTVTIEKYWGPLWAQQVRVRMDYDADEWVFEREKPYMFADGTQPERPDWIEVGRTPFMTEDDEKMLDEINGG